MVGVFSLQQKGSLLEMREVKAGIYCELDGNDSQHHNQSFPALECNLTSSLELSWTCQTLKKSPGKPRPM